MKLSTNNIRCVYCGSNGLDIHQDPPICNHCGHSFPCYDGIPFLGSYHLEDTLGLMEITSKISTPDDPVRVRQGIEKKEVEFSGKFERTYIEKSTHQPANPVVGSSEMAQAVRLREWAGFELLSTECDFKGKLCLDMGAGSGADSVRLIQRGADVICVDYNPISIKGGSLIAHEAIWLGGNSNCLPFASDTFDISIANAALHHMNDLAGSIREMYRVTKPGGFIFLISDPFSKNVSSNEEYEREELRIFDRHPMVMNGVNEGVIPFNRYAEAIESLDPDAKLLTMRVKDGGEHAETPSYWRLNDGTKTFLGKRAGNISALMRVGSIQIQPPRLNGEEIPTAQLFSRIGDPRKSMSFLLPYLPRRHFDDFPFKVSSKFLLMNGWNAKQNFRSDWRKGYNRVRLYLSDGFLSLHDAILIRPGNDVGKPGLDLYFSVNGERGGSLCVNKEKPGILPLATLKPLSEKNVIEIGVADTNENQGAIWQPYSADRAFEVAMRPQANNFRSNWRQYFSALFRK